MDDQERWRIAELLELARRRKFELDKQAVTLGVSAPAEVALQIRDLTIEIQQYEAALAQSGQETPTDMAMTAARPNDQTAATLAAAEARAQAAEARTTADRAQAEALDTRHLADVLAERVEWLIRSFVIAVVAGAVAYVVLLAVVVAILIRVF